MHLKKLSRVVAVTVVLTMVTPSAVFAGDMTKVGTNKIEEPEDTDSASIKDQDKNQKPTGSENPENSDNPNPVEPDPENPNPENPDPENPNPENPNPENPNPDPENPVPDLPRA